MNEKRYRPGAVHKSLKEASTGPKKWLSQNFLIDGNIVRKIANSAAICKEDTVLEIGPGTGVLTEELAKRAGEVIAIEKDRKLAAILDLPGVSVVQGDFLDLPIEELLAGKRVKLVANIPYSITTPILERVLPLYDHFESVTLMMQREVAERCTAGSSLSLFVQFYSTPSILFDVSRNSFYPRPTVTSTVIQFKLKKAPEDLPRFFEYSRTAYKKRRKMLRSSLRGLAPPEKIEAILVSIGKSPQARPEELSFEDFLLFVRRLDDEESPSSQNTDRQE